ncbi:universal stress protein [Actinoplanes sp. KI2]|uniref:universal stress protein n=1 Tax=Actinoplanes sp. KI2 TaxID=2983315 RepID=UPI0021D59E5C|nr:universal stress protein [Actinoplanes sp. KI2]MCU7729451.1 universal stress protein [Actinoplanes sp. KI2]
MNTRPGAPIVVGVDGSPPSLVAVETAVAEAALRHRGLRIVHAFTWPPAAAATTPGLTGSAQRMSWEQAEHHLAEATRIADKCAPDVTTTAEMITGPAAPVLLDESRGAALLVLGDRGLGGLTELLIGSVACHTTTHAHCPVIVVRGDSRLDGPVVAGVDGSATSALALDFAAEEAALRGTDLVTVHAWGGGDSTDLNADLPMTYEFWSGEEEEKRVLAEAVAGLAERHPDLRIRQQARRGSARRMLTGWSRTAQLVVVGNRGHGGFTGLLLGSVSQYLIHHAGCPVAVVRPGLSETDQPSA